MENEYVVQASLRNPNRWRVHKWDHEKGRYAHFHEVLFVPNRDKWVCDCLGYKRHENSSCKHIRMVRE